MDRDTEEILRLRTEVSKLIHERDELRARLAAVLELHSPVSWHPDICSECEMGGHAASYPCPTALAARGEQA